MKKKILRVCDVLICVVIIICSIGAVTNFLELKESNSRYSAYFAEKEQIDVLFVGSSHVRHGFFPMELWNDYGIASYNLAVNGNTIPVSYWTLVNALDYQTPEVVVMDVFNMWPGRVFSQYWGQVHDAADVIPLSVNKYRMVQDLFSDKTLTDIKGNHVYEKRWELLWSLGEYHSRWNDLQTRDFYTEDKIVENSRIWKGAYPLVRINPREEHIYGLSEEDLQYDEIAKSYLEKMIALCDEKGIELLLINTSYDCSDEAKLFHDSVSDIALEHGIKYIDFTQEDIINFSTDLYSSGHNTHVNFSGAQRFTDYIGTVLHNDYELKDHRNDENYKLWWDDYERFVKSKIGYLRSQEQLDLYAMFLNDNDYDILIQIKDHSILEENSNLAALVNLGISEDELKVTNNLLAVDVLNRKVSSRAIDVISKEKWNSSIGEVSVITAEEGKCDVCLNGKEVFSMEVDDGCRAIIAVLDRKTQMVLDVRKF